MTSLEQIFSEDNLLRYSNVCFDLAVDLPEERGKWGGRKFDTLVIPSRGAVPFFLGMVYSLGKVSSSFGGIYQEFYKNLGVQRMVSSLLPDDVNLDDVNGEGVNVLLIPFTADLNVSHFNPRLDNSEFTKLTREYWSRVTRAFFEDPKSRKKDPYFASFVDLLLREVEGRDNLAEVYESFPTVGSFAMIDTVISGRASNDILGSLERLATEGGNPLLEPVSFLVIDENGQKLRRNFERYLNGKKHEGLSKQYRIPRIVSEDEGASLLGVAAAIYPSIMDVSREFTVNGRPFFIGAGTWHNSADLDGNYFENFKLFMETIYRGIDYVYARDFSDDDGLDELEVFYDSRRTFLDRAEEVGILNKTHESISSLNSNKNYSYGFCYETSSHVLHAPFTSESEERLRSKICQLPRVKCLDEITVASK
jgi:hypothetical protein